MTFWVSSRKRIEKSTFNGAQRVVIHVKDISISCTHGITLDRQQKLIFRTDCGNGIESSDYGNNRKLLIQIRDAYDLLVVAFTSSFLYVGGYDSDTIYTVNNSNGTLISSVQLSFYNPRGIVAHNRTLQPPGTVLRKLFYCLHEKRNVEEIEAAPSYKRALI